MSEKAQETSRLQDEVDEARRRQQEASEQLLKATTQSMQQTRMFNMGVNEHELGDESDLNLPNGDVSKSIPAVVRLPQVYSVLESRVLRSIALFVKSLAEGEICVTNFRKARGSFPRPHFRRGGTTFPSIAQPWAVFASAPAPIFQPIFRASGHSSGYQSCGCNAQRRGRLHIAWARRTEAGRNLLGEIGTSVF